MFHYTKLFKEHKVEKQERIGKKKQTLTKDASKSGMSQITQQMI